MKNKQNQCCKAAAVEALGQHVQQQAPDELVRVKPHRLPAARTVDAIGRLKLCPVIRFQRSTCGGGGEDLDGLPVVFETAAIARRVQENVRLLQHPKAPVTAAGPQRADTSCSAAHRCCGPILLQKDFGRPREQH
jgi:hypothetical protein